MATTVTSSIGTGGDYTTVQAWEDACPANLVTADQIWRGELKNQTFNTGGSAVVVFGGSTTDATRYVELTVEAGASFVDNASVETNTLRYNTANGAALTGGGSYTDTISIAVATHLKLSRFQVFNGAPSSVINQAADGGFTQIQQVIVEGAGGLNQPVILRESASYIANSLVVNRAASGGNTFRSRGDASAFNCTLVFTSGAGAAHIQSGYSSATVRNCGMFGAGAVTAGGTPSYTTCITDVASPPSGCTTTAYSTGSGALFQNITDGTHDFRIKTGSSLIEAGTTDATYGTPSINGQARPQGGSYDVGAWEFLSGGGGGGSTALRKLNHFLRA